MSSVDDGAVGGAPGHPQARRTDGHHLLRRRTEGVKEAAIAIEEERVYARYERNGFEIVHVIRGGWRLPERPQPIQDLVLARLA